MNIANHQFLDVSTAFNPEKIGDYMKFCKFLNKTLSPGVNLNSFGY